MKKILAIIFLMYFVGMYAGFEYHKYSVSQDKEDLAKYQSTYLSKNGYSKKYGDFHLRSFDRGKHWYAVDTTDGIVVIGEAEKVYPGILTHIDRANKLFAHVRKYGFLDSDGKKTLEDFMNL